MTFGSPFPQLDLKTIATYYGTTYDTLENRFRKIKKDADILKAEVDGGDRVPTTPRKSKTPKKDTLSCKYSDVTIEIVVKSSPLTRPATAVAHGRVVKASPITKKTIKQGQVEDIASSIFGSPMESELT